MPIRIITITIALAAALWLICLIYYIRKNHVIPIIDQYVQWKRIDQELAPLGFAYDLRKDCICARQDCWQRKMGYMSRYDENALSCSMVRDCEPVTFEYKGQLWLIEFRKGQYGIAAGGENGVYHATGNKSMLDQNLSQMVYQAAEDTEMLPMSFVLKKNGEVLFQRKDIHWWLSGFRPGTYVEPSELTMEIQIAFPNWEMCAAFIGGLKRFGYKKGEYFSWNTTEPVPNLESIAVLQEIL